MEAIILLGLAAFGIAYLWSQMGQVARAAALLFMSMVYFLTLFNIKSVVDNELLLLGAPKWSTWTITIIMVVGGLGVVVRALFNLRRVLKRNV